MMVLFTVCLSVVVLVSAQAEQKLKNCNEVRTAYSSKGFNVNDVPNKGVHGKLHQIQFYKSQILVKFWMLWLQFMSIVNTQLCINM